MMRNKQRIFWFALAAFPALFAAAHATAQPVQFNVTVCTTLQYLDVREDCSVGRGPGTNTSCGSTRGSFLADSGYYYLRRLEGAVLHFYMRGPNGEEKILGTMALDAGGTFLSCKEFDLPVNQSPGVDILMKFKWRARRTDNRGVTVRVMPMWGGNISALRDPSELDDAIEELVPQFTWPLSAFPYPATVSCGHEKIEANIRRFFGGDVEAFQKSVPNFSSVVPANVLDKLGCIVGARNFNGGAHFFPFLSAIVPGDNEIAGIPDGDAKSLRNHAASILAGAQKFLKRFGNDDRWDSDSLTPPSQMGPSKRFRKEFWFVLGKGGKDRSRTVLPREDNEFREVSLPVKPYVIEHSVMLRDRTSAVRALAMEFERSMRRQGDFSAVETLYCRAPSIERELDGTRDYRSPTQALGLGCATRRAFASLLAMRTWFSTASSAGAPLLTTRKVGKALEFLEFNQGPSKYYSGANLYYPKDAYENLPLPNGTEYHLFARATDATPAAIAAERGVAHSELQIARALWDLVDTNNKGLSNEACSGAGDSLALSLDDILKAYVNLWGADVAPPQDHRFVNDVLLRERVQNHGEICRELLNNGKAVGTTFGCYRTATEIQDEQCEFGCAVQSCLASNVISSVEASSAGLANQRELDYPTLIDFYHQLFRSGGLSASLRPSVLGTLFTGRCTYPKQVEFPTAYINPLAVQPQAFSTSVYAREAFAQSLETIFSNCFEDKKWDQNNLASLPFLHGIASIKDTCNLLRCEEPHAIRGGETGNVLIEACSEDNAFTPTVAAGCFDAREGSAERAAMTAWYGENALLACSPYVFPLGSQCTP